MNVRSIEWIAGKLRILDQTLLPNEQRYLELTEWSEVVDAIQSLKVRGAPALGIAGAYALVLAGQRYQDVGVEEFGQYVRVAGKEIAQARPTAVNLSQAVQRMLGVLRGSRTPKIEIEALLQEAFCIQAEDLENNKKIGEHGANLIPPGATLLTHCNTGTLATGGHGTALGIVRTAWSQGKLKGVVATETRPLLQGSRLTAWELVQDGIPVSLTVDSAAGFLMNQGAVTAVVVGADRIAANGDVANKIGTYTLAVLAKANKVPVYVAAPCTSVDLLTPSGADIPIEERGSCEVIAMFGKYNAPPNVEVWNPAFDVTPAKYVTAIITEVGVLWPPYTKSLKLNCSRTL